MIYKSFCLFFLSSLLSCTPPVSNEKGAGQMVLGTTQGEDSVVLINPKVNFYIENSGSMFGYVDKGTELDDFVSGFLTDLVVGGYCDSLGLNYVNSKAIPFEGNVNSFVKGLNKQNFIKAGGNLSESHIADIFEKVLEKHQSNSVSILLSDCIFSPGKKVNADSHLSQQRDFIKVAFSQKLKQDANLGITVLQLYSKFHGKYYNREDQPTQLNDVQRPYYVWVIGDKRHLTQLFKEHPQSRYKGGGVKNSFSIIRGGQAVSYAVIPGSGSFKPAMNDPKRSIEKAQLGSQGAGQSKMQFAVNVNFAGLLLEEAYLSDLSNYEVVPKGYHLQIEKSTTNGYSHKLTFSSPTVIPARLSVKLKSRIPEWVVALSDEVGLNIHADGAMSKTYGLSFLVNGVYEAFANKSDYYAEIKININQ